MKHENSILNSNNVQLNPDGTFTPLGSHDPKSGSWNAEKPFVLSTVEA